MGKSRTWTTKLYFLSLLAVAVALDPIAVSAQYTIEEVVVTARKREETLQQAPLSILPFDAETLERADLTNVSDIARRVPGLQFNVSNVTDAEIFLRGIGSDIESAAAERAVGVFVDGVYLSRNSGTLVDIFDLERVEVVRGPQSLLFGKNVVGGLIHYVTQKPTQEFAAKLEATVGNYDRINVRGSVRGGISEGVSGSLAFSTRYHDGYADITGGPTPNQGTGDEEELDSKSVRGQLLFDLDDNLSLLISADYAKRDAGARWVDLVTPGDSRAVGFLGFLGPGGGTAIGVPDDFTLANRNAPFQSDDRRGGSRNFEGYQDAELWGTSARFEWQINDEITITSLTAYRDTDIELREDGCGLLFSFPVAANGAPDISSLVGATIPTYLAMVPDCYFDQYKSDAVEQISEELTISWDNGGPLSLRAGFYYLNEDINRSEIVSHMFQDYGLLINVAFNAAFGGGPTIGAGDIDPGGTDIAITETDADNYGVFGEFNYAITEQLAVNAGVRWVRDEKDFTVYRGGVTFNAPYTDGPFTGTDSESWTEWLPSAILTYAPTDAANLYFRYARGYKSGGWNGENAPNEIISDVAFEPEVADTFEIGGKFQLMENRLRLNLAGYFAQYDELQTQQFVTFAQGVPPDNVIVNADGTEAWGIEADLSFLVTDNLSIWANYAYIDCEFKKSVIVDDDGTDIKGNTCRRAPENAFGIGGEIRNNFQAGGNGYARVNYSWTDDFYFENENDPASFIDDEFTLDASAGYITSNNRWSISVWGKNITNERNISSNFELFGSLYRSYIAPRTYGVTVRYSQ